MTAILERERLPASAAQPPTKDKTARYVMFGATVLSIAAYLWYWHKGQTIAYEDSVSHMEIARRVIDSPTTGLGQLGGVWLPLPHLLMVPFVWFDPFYYSGFAGSMISMAAYIATGVLLYKIVHGLTDNKIAAVIGAGVFLTNPNVLYMQSTPMTELLLFACMAGMVFGVQRWIQTDRKPYLYGAGFASLLGVLTRYEAWILMFCLAAVVTLTAWHRSRKYSETEGVSLCYLFGGGIAIGLWLLYCKSIFGNALEWENGPYAKPSLWVGKADATNGNWLISIKVYGYAMASDLLLPGLAVLILGVLAVVVHERTSVKLGPKTARRLHLRKLPGIRLHTLPALSLLVMALFFIYSLESGQRPLHVPQVNGGLYNVRFGLLMILPTAIVAGYLVSLFGGKLLKVTATTLAAVMLTYGAAQVPLSHVVTLTEPETWAHQSTATQFAVVSKFLKANYDKDGKGVILAQFFRNEEVLFKAHIGLGQNIYEGSYKIWAPALAHPTDYKVKWIIMQTIPTDQVYAALHDSPILNQYRLVFDQAGYKIYEKVS